MAGVERRVKDEPAFSGGRGWLATTIKSRGYLVPVRMCWKELYNPAGTDNSLTNERHSEHFTGQHKAQIKPGCESLSAEASSCGDTRHQPGITFILSRSLRLVLKQNKGPATEQARVMLAGETWDIALLHAVLINSSLSSPWPVALNSPSCP